MKCQLKLTLAWFWLEELILTVFRYCQYCRYFVHFCHLLLQLTMWQVSVFGVFLVQMLKTTDQENCEYEHFSRSDYLMKNKGVVTIVILIISRVKKTVIFEMKNTLFWKSKWGMRATWLPSWSRGPDLLLL